MAQQKGNVCYLAGPMSGIDLFNFPAFDAWAQRLRDMGYTVISPAELDRVHGFDEYHPCEITQEVLRSFIMRDVLALCECTHIALLPGWERSRGTLAELHIARFLGIEEMCLSAEWWGNDIGHS